MSELHLVVGGAGCIGSELVGALLAQGNQVRVLDNLSSGRLEHLQEFDSHKDFDFIKGSVLQHQVLYDAMWDVDMIWHLAAKTDIKFIGEYDFGADMRDNFNTTWAILKAMLTHKVRRIAFASSAAVYGEGPVDETAIPAPISFYGGTKLACEAIIRSLALRMGMTAWMFRYCSIVSSKARKSGNMVIPDLIHKLRENPFELEIYGDSNQTKPSLLVSECVEAMLFAVANAKDQVNLFNIGAPDAISVTRQAELIIKAMGLKDVTIKYTGGAGGWPGDVPSFNMKVDKMAQLGWKAKRTSEEAVKEAIAGLLVSGE
jgi:UDP-glucose 4-epimerase